MPRQDLKRSAEGFVIVVPWRDGALVYRPDSLTPSGGKGFYTRAQAVEALRTIEQTRRRNGVKVPEGHEPYAERIGERFDLADAEANFPCLYRLPGDPPIPGLPADDPRNKGA